MLASYQTLAHAWPEKTVTLVVTQGPGSGSDVLARLIAGHLSKSIGQSVIVENRVGASGIIGHEYVMRAPADGHTLLFTSTAVLLVVPEMNAAAKFRYTDFVPMASVMRAPFAVLVANTPAAPKSMPELLQAMRAKPSDYSSAGAGTMTHLASELILKRAGLQATHIPYKGSGQSLTDLMGGQVLFSTDSLTASVPLIKSGRLRALAVTGAERSASLPTVPTLAESGFPELQISVIGGIFGPKGTPREVVDKVNAEIVQVLRNPEILQRFSAMETQPLTVTNDQFTQMMRREAGIWGQLVKQLNLKIE
jgi:tripartite-type tricarboxylate transporter receptor subunit TctC